MKDETPQETVRPTRREILELENTEYDYGHDVPKWTSDKACIVPDLHKRLEEAKKEGYKEAIKVAKEWMKEQYPNYMEYQILAEEVAQRFETDMNKLWEEMKDTFESEFKED